MTSTVVVIAVDSVRAFSSDGRQICIPITSEEGLTEFEPVDSDVVGFRSAARDASGFHSLIQVNSEGRTRIRSAQEYHLPALAKVRLESIQEPGTWRAYGKVIQRRLYMVSVTF